MSFLKAIITLVIFTASSLITCNAGINGLEVSDSATLQAKFNGQIFIAQDNLIGSGNWANAQSKVDKISDRQTINLWCDQTPNLTFRKESSLDADGLEITIKADYKSYSNLVHGYSFEIPMAFLDGYKYTLYHGRHWGFSTLEGTFTKDMPDGLFNGITWNKYLIIQKGDKALTFDFNLSGVFQGYTDAPFGGEIQGAALIKKKGDKMVFSFFDRSVQSSGGVYMAKFRITPEVVPIESVHPHMGWDYHGWPAQAKWNFTFGTVEYWNSANKNIFDTTRNWGWVKTPATELITVNNRNYYESCIYSSNGKAEQFQVKVMPGLYMLTINAGSPKVAIEGMKISANGETLAENIKVAAKGNQRINKLCYVKAPNNLLALEFSGAKNWAVKNIMITPVMSQYEDYFIMRKMWRIDGISTPIMNIKEAPQNLEPALKVKPAYDLSKMKWRSNMRMTTWSTESHAGTNFEFNTPELVEKRVKEIKSAGFNTINIGTTFWSLCYRDRVKEVAVMLRMVADAAHQEGLVVIYHVDLPVVYSMGTGMNYLMEHPDWIKTQIQTGSPAFALMCLNNPGFMEDTLKFLKQITYFSGIDGFMLDEFYAHAKEVCGCDSCRALFKKDTGLDLPLDVSSSAWYNLNDPTYTAFVNWRLKNVGDQWVQVYKELSAINPNVTLMTYTNEDLELGYGARSNVEYGMEMTQMARGSNFIGVESATDNPLDYYRMQFMFRKINYDISHFAMPAGVAWCLVYNNGPNSCFAGWAITNMNIGTPWIPSQYSGAEKYLLWERRINADKWKPEAQIAMVFSVNTRNFGQKPYASIGEMMGFSQALTNNHIMHNFLFDDELTAKRLSKYKLVILPAIGCLSKEAINNLISYARQGGRLLITGNTGIYNPIGFAGDLNAMANLTGVKYTNNYLNQPADPKTAPKDITDSFNIVKNVDANILAKNNDNILLTSKKIGNGEVYYYAKTLGIHCYEGAMYTGNTYKYSRDSEAIKQIAELTRQVFGKGLNFIAPQAPEKVVMTYLQSIQNPNQRAICLLNLTASRDYKIGDTLQGENWKDAFPALTAPIVLEVALPEITSAYITSPDYAEKREIAIKKLGDGHFEITLKPEDCKTYSIVYIN